MTGRTDSPELLLDHLHALRALAGRLTRDGHAAEDAVQDTVVTALTRFQRLAATPPRAVGAWLAVILRNRLRERAREESRRAAREAALPGVGSAPSTLDVVEELALHHRIVELVHELPEPYRQTVFLRYFRGWSPREIADASGVPHKTVHTRLERAIARLRVRLDAEPGGRRSWLPALAAVRPRPVAATAVGGILLMKTKLLLAAGVVAAVLGLLSLLRVPDGAVPAPGAEVPPADRTAAVAGQPAADRGPPGDVPTRATIPDAAAPPRAEEAPPARLHGIVRDLDARPVPGVAIVFAPSEAGVAPPTAEVVATEPARSAADGRFSMALPPADGVLTTDSAEWVAVSRPWVAAGSADVPVELVVAPRRRYGGTVVDPRGHPIAGAEVVVALEGIMPVRTVGHRVVALPSDLGSATTSETGRFELDRVGYLRGLSLAVSRPQFRPGGCDLPAESTPDLLIELAPATEAATVHGVVVTAVGKPVSDAWVAAVGTKGSGEAVRSDGAGRFAVRLRSGDRPERVTAVHREFGAVTASLAADPQSPAGTEERPLLLQFPATLGLVRGRVVDATGEPVAGARVWTPDLTYFGTVPFEQHGRQYSRDASVEGLSAGDHPLSLATTSSTDGSFELRGLTPRRYALFALAPDTLAGVGPVLAAPGESIELRVVATSPRPIAGRVLSRSGSPLPGVHVALGRRFAWQPPPREVEPWTGTGMRVPRAAQTLHDHGTTTDAEGRFAFGPVAVDGSFVSLSGEVLFLPPPFPLANDLPLDDLEIVVDTRSAFRVELHGAESADEFSLVGPDGAHVPLFVRVDDAQMSLGRVPIVDRQSCEAYSFAGPVTLVLWSDGAEVRRTTVTLPEGRGHVVRP